MEATLNKNENNTWKFVKKPGNIMEISWNFVIMEKWEPCSGTLKTQLTYSASPHERPGAPTYQNGNFDSQHPREYKTFPQNS